MKRGICKINTIYYGCLYFAAVLVIGGFSDSQLSKTRTKYKPQNASTQAPSVESSTSTRVTSTPTSTSTTVTSTPTSTSTTETTSSTSSTPTSTPTGTSKPSSKPSSTSNVPTTNTSTSRTTVTMTSSSTTETSVLTTAATTPRTTVRPTTTKLPEKNPCQNGGTWDDDDNKCVCPDPYDGTYCERIDDEIEVEEVEASVDVTLRITSQNFSQELENKNSLEYKIFSKDFENQMDNIYRTVEGYRGVKIIKIRQGSIIVDHEVILAMKTSEGVSEEVLNKKVENIKASLKNSSAAGGNNGFGFDHSSIDVKTPVLKDNCTALVSGNAGKYYKLVITGAKAVCVSICDSARNDSMKCGNGICGMTSDGPLCYCDVGQDYWYFGVHCDHAIHKNGLIAGLSVTLIVLVLGVLAIVIYNMKFCRTIKQYESKGDEQKKEIMDIWKNDQWECSNSGSDIGIEKRH